MPQHNGMDYRRVRWKYVLNEPYIHRFTSSFFRPGHMTIGVVCEHYRISGDRIEFKPGFGWDGASGPTVDSENTMRASLVHDCLYRAIKDGAIRPQYRARSDREFRRILKQDGMTWLRRWIWWWAVRLGGAHRV